MSVLVVITSEVDAAPLVRWGARLARARDTSLKVVHLVNANAELELEELSIRDKGETDDLVLQAVRQEIQGSLVQNFTVRFEAQKTSKIRDLLREAEQEREEVEQIQALIAEGKPLDARLLQRKAELDQPSKRPSDESLARLQEEGFLSLRRAGGPDPVQTVLTLVRGLRASLLVVSKTERRPGAQSLDPGPELLERAPCDTMLLRAPAESGKKCDRVLIPAAGGPHSIVALRLGAGLAMSDQCLVTPLYVETDAVDEDVAREVGNERMAEIFSAAKLDFETPGILPQVVLAESPTAGINKAVREISQDLVLVGASDVGFMKRVLFGSIPEHVFQGRDATAVAVLRKARPLTTRAVESVERWFRGWLPQLNRADRVALFKHLEEGSEFNTDFASLIALSTAIASLGLVQNSPAVVIGAMLVAPLMTPMIGMGLALVQGNMVLVSDAFAAITKGFFLALFISVLSGLMARSLGMIPGGELTNELLARGAPTMLDLIVAWLSGLAAAYALARPNLSGAFPGVAIAAALVPPIGTVGIALANGHAEVASGAALLFGTNLVAIVLGAAAVFRLMGVRANRSQGSTRLWARRALVGLVLIVGVLGGWFVARLPLWVTQEKPDLVVLDDTARTALRLEVEANPGHTVLLIRSINHGAMIEVVVVCDGPVADDLPDRLALRAKKQLRRDVPVRLLVLEPRGVARVGSAR